MNNTGKCCLCGGEYTMGGCNPDPVCTIPDARCCHKCNMERVLPARGMEHVTSCEEHFAALEHADVRATVEIYTNHDEEELYISCPVSLWESIVLDNLRKASAISEGEVKSLIDKTIRFCEYCEEEHAY